VGSVEANDEICEISDLLDLPIEDADDWQLQRLTRSSWTSSLLVL